MELISLHSFLATIKFFPKKCFPLRCKGGWIAEHELDCGTADTDDHNNMKSVVGCTGKGRCVLARGRSQSAAEGLEQNDEGARRNHLGPEGAERHAAGSRRRADCGASGKSRSSLR